RLLAQAHTLRDAIPLGGAHVSSRACGSDGVLAVANFSDGRLDGKEIDELIAERPFATAACYVLFLRSRPRVPRNRFHHEIEISFLLVLRARHSVRRHIPERSRIWPGRDCDERNRRRSLS